MPALLAIADVLRQVIGLDPDTLGMRSIELSVRERMAEIGTHDLDAYATRLAFDRAEQHALIEKIVVPETWFFRDRVPFDFFARHARAKWRKRETPIRVLSLPSSTGEEPYSVAMVLLDNGFPRDRFQIDAADISEHALRRALLGIYTQNAFRGQDVRFRDYHFTPVPPDRYEIDTNIRECVNFRQGNILEMDQWTMPASYDAIFSRNLLIYLDEGPRNRAVESLYRALKPGGLLFVGHAEVLPIFRRRFQPVREPGAFAYYLPDGSEKIPPPAAVMKPLKRPNRNTLTARLAAARKDGAPIRPGTPTSASIPPIAAPTQRVRIPAPNAPAAPPPVTPPAFDPEEALNQARLLADQGAYDAAGDLCRKCIENDRANAEAHYLMGVVLEARGDAAEAEASYRRALYLQPRHQEALFHLALLLQHQGRPREAAQLRSRVERAARVATTPES